MPAERSGSSSPSGSRYHAVTRVVRMSDITTVGIIGSGIMGSGLVAVAARAGFDVVIRSRTSEGAARVVAAVERNLGKLVEKGKLDDAARTAALERITPTDHLGRLAECDLVIESVVEDLDV